MIYFLQSTNQSHYKLKLSFYPLLCFFSILPLEYFGFKYASMFYWYHFLVLLVFFIGVNKLLSLKSDISLSVFLCFALILFFQFMFLHDYYSFFTSVFYFVVVFFSCLLLKQRLISKGTESLYFIANNIFIFIAVLSFLQIIYAYTEIDLFIPRYIDSCCTARWGGNTDEIANWFYGTEGYLYTNKRINGLYQEASIFSFFISLLVLPFYIFFRQYFLLVDKKKALVCLVMIIIYLIILLASKSSSALLMFFLYFILFFAIFKARMMLFIPIIASVFYIFYSTGALDKYILKLFDLSYGSTYTRFLFAEIMTNGIMDKPILGFGKSNFIDFIQDYIPPNQDLGYETTKQLEDNVLVVSVAYLGFALDYGCISLVLLIGLLINKLIKSIQNHSYGCIAFFAGFLIALLSNVSIYMPYMIFAFALFSVLSSLSFKKS